MGIEMTDMKSSSVVHRGRVPAAGFFFAFGITSEDEAIRRILSIWQPNSRVYRFRKGLLLVLPKPVLVSVGETIGLPLIRNRGLLTGMPLTEKEVRAIVQLLETLIISEGGTVSAEQLRSEEHTSELQSLTNLVCRLLLEKKKKKSIYIPRLKHQELCLNMRSEHVRDKYFPQCPQLTQERHRCTQSLNHDYTLRSSQREA